MKNYSATKAALALLMILTLSSCSSLSPRLAKASAISGTIEAGIDIGRLPPDCRKKEPHATLIAGSEVRSVLKLERQATDNANDRVLRCAGHFDSLKSSLENKK